MEQHLPAQHEEQFGGVVVGVGRNPVAGVVNLQEDRCRRCLLRIVQQRQAAVVAVAEAKALELFGPKDAREQRTQPERRFTARMLGRRDGVGKGTAP